MIRNDAEYRESVQRLSEMEARLKDQRTQLKTMNLKPDEIKRVLDPTRAFQQQIRAEVTAYERLQRGEFDDVINLSALGQLLIAVRIASGVTQRELAERMQVSESQVSRDERNEYHGITADRANRILEVLGAEVRTTVTSTSAARSKPRVAATPKSSRT